MYERSYSNTIIIQFIADQLYGIPKQEKQEEGGEEEEEAENEETLVTPKLESEPSVKYEIIGTLHKPFHKKSEDILFTMREESEDFFENIMKCGFVIYDITKDPEEIPKALSTLAGNNLFCCLS